MEQSRQKGVFATAMKNPVPGWREPDPMTFRSSCIRPGKTMIFWCFFVKNYDTQLFMSSRPTLLALASALPLFWPSEALAYIGPGAGLSAIGTFVALVGALLLAIIGFIWYPLKRLIKRRKSDQAADPVEDSSGQT
ncbi:MAG: hypothetical protein RIE24_04745 [Silicimonas sp.]